MKIFFRISFRFSRCEQHEEPAQHKSDRGEVLRSICRHLRLPDIALMNMLKIGLKGQLSLGVTEARFNFNV